MRLIRRLIWAPRRPPGPTGIDSIQALLEARRDPLGFARDVVNKYGDVVSYRFGPFAGYLLRHPDHVQHVLRTNHRRYSKQNFNYEALKPVLGNGLITSEGEDWLRARRRIQPLFHGERISSFGPMILRATSEMLARWDASVSRREPVDISQEMTKLTLRIAGETILGRNVTAAAEPIAESFAELNEDVAYRFRNPFSLPRWIPTRRNRAFRKALEKLDTSIYEIIRCRGDSDGRGENLLDLLSASDEIGKDKRSHAEIEAAECKRHGAESLAAEYRRHGAESRAAECKRHRADHGAAAYASSESQLRDQAMTLILAGHETTAALLTWIWYLLAVHPKVSDRLRRELNCVLGARLAEVDDLQQLTYARCVIQEALRLYPPVWIISRKAEEDDQIGRYDVPSGTVVTLCSYLVHRHPSFWRRPETFEPERFLRQEIPSRHAFSYMPFGGGPRQCIGGHLAMKETMLILTTAFRRYRAEVVAEDDLKREPLVTLRPSVTMLAQPQPG